MISIQKKVWLKLKHFWFNLFAFSERLLQNPSFMSLNKDNKSISNEYIFTKVTIILIQIYIYIYIFFVYLVLFAKTEFSNKIISVQAYKQDRLSWSFSKIDTANSDNNQYNCWGNVIYFFTINSQVNSNYYNSNMFKRTNKQT